MAEWPRASNKRVTVPLIKARHKLLEFHEVFSQAFFMDTINHPLSTHTVTAVYLATDLSLHALERVADSIRGTKSAQCMGRLTKTSCSSRFIDQRKP